MQKLSKNALLEDFQPLIFSVTSVWNPVHTTIIYFFIFSHFVLMKRSHFSLFDDDKQMVLWPTPSPHLHFLTCSDIGTFCLQQCSVILAIWCHSWNYTDAASAKCDVYGPTLKHL